MKIKYYVLPLSIFLFTLITPIAFSQQTCYLLIENSGSYQPQIVSSLSLSLVREYIEWVDPIPPDGVTGQECIYRVSVTEDQSSIEVILSGKQGSSFGDSILRGKEGLKQAMLRAIYRASKPDKQQKICQTYQSLVDECEQTSPAVVAVIPPAEEPKPEELDPEEVSEVEEPLKFKDLKIQIYSGFGSQEISFTITEDGSESKETIKSTGIGLGGRYLIADQVSVNAHLYSGRVTEIETEEGSDKEVFTNVDGQLSRTSVSFDYHWFFTKSIFSGGLGFYHVSSQYSFNQTNEKLDVQANGLAGRFGYDRFFTSNVHLHIDFSILFSAINQSGSRVDAYKDAGNTPSIASTGFTIGAGYAF